ncbi:ABC transporter substrate-binding protein [Variovorax sp. J22G21]|uniref:ABC transporter substrate-binding protein n=1 Tax=Variovorax fucosicus TaxID=3053517 RepID=UPI00257664EE|nr:MULTISPECIES: ABC transporter substrate-binding protein [unclassified Variovorax]MDM0041748.1 ABC transporter substrate-binding protein [Variovorax sp. J22R193]MDM0059587.1 ABC transporter substrate-binding protein [Variovorax sp. J22G21]
MKSHYRLLTSMILMASSLAAFAQELRIGLQEDVDVLDPHRGRTYVGRIVFASLCDKLLDTDARLQFVPKLAKAWSWSQDGMVLTMTLRDDTTFHDGTRFDASAAKANLERAMTLPESMRKADLASLQKIEAPNATTLVLTLKRPDATLLAQLSDRAGMMLSPKSFTGVEAAVPGRQPVCSGPYKFVNRIQNDRIVLEKFDAYYEARNYAFRRVTFYPIGDATVRLSNLRAGDLDLVERVNPTDVPLIKSDRSMQMQSTPGLGYVMLMFNVNNGNRAKGNPFADKRVRQALQWTLDRKAINEVAGGGIFDPAQQPLPPASPFYSDKYAVTRPNLEKARELLKEAGQSRVKAEVLFPNNTTASSVMEMVQAMAAQAGFELSIRPVENAALESEGASGNFQARFNIWSGRVDPDANIAQHFSCKGSINEGKYCNLQLDGLLDEARSINDVAKRKAIYERVQTIIQDELPAIFLYYQPWPFATASKVKGFVPSPDGMIRLSGVHFGQK